MSRQPNAWTPGHSTCINHGACGPTCPEYRVEDCAGCLDAIEDAPTRPDLPRLQPLAMRIGNALAACSEPEAEDLWLALRALQRLSEKDRRDMIGYVDYCADADARGNMRPLPPVRGPGSHAETLTRDEDVRRAIRGLERCTPADRARLIQSIERHADGANDHTHARHAERL